MADYYQILGVSRGASVAEVRSAYARLARERHPDRFTDPAEKARAQEFFKEATAAFNALSNDRNRREYDSELERPKLVGPEEIARDAYTRGVQKLEAREYHDAVELMRTAVHHAPREARYHAALGRALAMNPHWAREAIQAVEHAIQLEPRQAAHHVLVAQMYHNQGLRLRARKAVEAALALAPSDPHVLKVAALVEQGSQP
jgi:curved DNA-binding protein CbpA